MAIGVGKSTKRDKAIKKASRKAAEKLAESNRKPGRSKVKLASVGKRRHTAVVTINSKPGSTKKRK